MLRSTRRDGGGAWFASLSAPFKGRRAPPEGRPGPRKTKTTYQKKSQANDQPTIFQCISGCLHSSYKKSKTTCRKHKHGTAFKTDPRCIPPHPPPPPPPPRSNPPSGQEGLLKQLPQDISARQWPGAPMVWRPSQPIGPGLRCTTLARRPTTRCHHGPAPGGGRSEAPAVVPHPPTPGPGGRGGWRRAGRCSQLLSDAKLA
jgi:hypothetical protein